MSRTMQRAATPVRRAATAPLAASRLAPAARAAAAPARGAPRALGPKRQRSGQAKAAAAEPPAPSVALVEPLGQGIAEDVARRAPHLVSDVTQGLNLKCLAAVCFMTFSCLAPAVAFGSLLAVKTAGTMGAFEMIAGSALCGMAYALFCGQPLTIIGSTGPVLAFTTILYSAATAQGLPFLPFYAWTGLWTAAILFVCAVTSASNLVKYLTRWTDEIFSALISAIFVFEAGKDLVGLLTSATVPASKALLSVGLALTTFFLAMNLRTVRTTRYFNATVRNAVSDFGPTIAILASAALGGLAVAKWGVALDFLQLPATLAPTTARPWLVDLFAAPVWVRWAAFVPAVMVSILLFFDQNITTRLVNSKDNKMVKGEGYHLDMLVMSVLTAVMSVLGLPWLIAATVRSINHLKALAVTEKTTAGGVEREVITGMTEQRVTGFGIHLAMGCCLLFG